MLERLQAPRSAALLLALCSAVLLLLAFGLQYGAGFAPCHLCLLQRWPHAAVILLGLAGWVWRPRPMLLLAGLALVASIGLAGYHVGVEQGWLALPESCAATGQASSIEDLRRLLAEAPPPCDQVSLTLFGLTLAGWNLLASLGLAAGVAWVLLRRPAATRAPHFTRRL